VRVEPPVKKKAIFNIEAAEGVEVVAEMVVST
jgi:hypothetical protein